MPDPRLEALKKRKQTLPEAPPVSLYDENDPTMPPRPTHLAQQQQSDVDWSGVPHTQGVVDWAKKMLEDPSQLSPVMKRQLEGFLYGGSQTATGSFGDELVGTLRGAADTQGFTPDQYRAAERARARQAINDAPVAATLGGVVGAAPLALLTGGLSLPAQALLGGYGLMELNAAGQSEGSLLDRLKAADSYIRNNPVETGLNVTAPFLYNYGSKAAGKVADWFGNKRLDQLSNLMSNPADRANLKSVRGLEAVRDQVRSAARAGLFKGAAVPTAETVSSNATGVIAKRGDDIERLTNQLLGEADFMNNPREQVDYQPIIDRLEAMKSYLENSTSDKRVGLQNKLQKAIDAVKNRGTAPQEVVTPEIDPTPPMKAADNRPVDATVDETRAMQSLPRDATQQEPLVSTPATDEAQLASGDNKFSEPPRLPAGASPNDQPNAMRFPRKELPAQSSAESLPDAALPEPQGPADAEAAPVEQWAREYYERAHANDTPRYPLATRSSSELTAGPKRPESPYSDWTMPNEPPPAGDELATRSPVGSTSLAAQRGYTPASEEPVDAQFSEAAKPGKPQYSQSLRNALDAQKLAAKDTDFDPQAQAPKKIDKDIAFARWLGHKEGTEPALTKMSLNRPELSGAIQNLRDANADYHIAKLTQYPAMLINEQNARHATTPRDLAYGLLSGHGAAVMTSRGLRGHVPGVLARAFGVGEKSALGAERTLDFLNKSGVPRSTSSADIVREGPSAEPSKPLSDRLMNAGAGLYDTLWGSTPQESVSERNDRMNKSIKQRLEEER